MSHAFVVSFRIPNASLIDSQPVLTHEGQEDLRSVGLSRVELVASSGLNRKN